MPRERIEHVLEGADLDCPCCGRTQEKIGEAVSEQLESEPASLRVLEYIRFTCAYKFCEEKFRAVHKPPQPIDKGMAGPGLLGALIVSKYSDHLPLYRLEEIFSSEGVYLPRSTTCSWMATCADLFTLLNDLSRQRILSSRVELWQLGWGDFIGRQNKQALLSAHMKRMNIYMRPPHAPTAQSVSGEESGAGLHANFCEHES